jgi:hypothetical protein
VVAMAELRVRSRYLGRRAAPVAGLRSVHGKPLGRTFRIRMRPGHGMVSAASDGTNAPRAEAGEEVVVPEKTAAFLVRRRAAEIIEVIDPPDAGKP